MELWRNYWRSSHGLNLVGLLNVDGYYNYLLTFIDKAVDDGFIKPSQRHIFVSAPNAKELVQKLEVDDLQSLALFYFLLSFSYINSQDKHLECVPTNDENIAKLKWEVVEPQQLVGFSALQTSKIAL
ncbi:hypothetical protein RHSIM_Rhsim11G0195900 [Rhododendron simsii]|uniref:cytokinin riboside 5'-monophosphate phosphoribohydrolase n=1 Tax=Rhododendron simsii TaxID=118357 RepID=A0A834G7A3_RHOSS|nr:hypothetical protein RHSIM_Rhsim11G0195900 [Rhododendron simsii]